MVPWDFEEIASVAIPTTVVLTFFLCACYCMKKRRKKKTKVVPIDFI